MKSWQDFSLTNWALNAPHIVLASLALWIGIRRPGEFISGSSRSIGSMRGNARVRPADRPVRRRRWRMVRRLTCGAIAALLLVAVPPAIFIGVNCYPGGPARPSANVAPPPVDIPGYQRAEAFTYLTLPEWFIVYSADEYARVVERGAPSDFPYLGSIAQYWGYYSSACAVTRSRYPFEAGYHVMLGVIGTSFTVEYLLKGSYESTVGRATGWFGRDTPEDRFAAKTAAEYGAFMHMVPWYEFTFGAHLRRLWTEVPLFGPRPVRKLERRLALTLEYSIKGVYGWLIGLTTRSAYGAEDLKIYSRIENARMPSLPTRKWKRFASSERAPSSSASRATKRLLEPRSPSLTRVCDFAMWQAMTRC